MKFIENDWTILREGEQAGLVVGMTGILERVRTELNDELSSYFRENAPKYSGIWDEEESDDILCSINDYLEDKSIDKVKLDFPISSGSDIHLIPIGENIKLKVLVVDEYNGGGDYDKCVMIDFFLINEKTTKQDVLELIGFVNTYLS